MKRFYIAAASMLLIGTAVAQNGDAARAARWQDLAEAIFGAREILPGAAKIDLEVADRAEDAALVPVTIRVENPRDINGIYLIIDNNPAPLAAHATFGPAGNAESLKLRVRIDQYTDMHAVEETKDGALYETHRFVKASGGCSAPSGSYDSGALASIGQMKLRVFSDATGAPSHEAQLLIRHPNYNGMQKDPATQGYTPARFLKSVDINVGGERVLQLDSDISLAADPAITFKISDKAKGKLKVEARDSDNAVFMQEFELGPGGS